MDSKRLIRTDEMTPGSFKVMVMRKYTVGWTTSHCTPVVHCVSICTVPSWIMRVHLNVVSDKNVKTFYIHDPNMSVIGLWVYRILSLYRGRRVFYARVPIEKCKFTAN